MDVTVELGIAAKVHDDMTGKPNAIADAIRRGIAEIGRLRASLESSREVNAKLCQRRDEMDAEIAELRRVNDSLVRWKGEIDQRRILLNLPFPDDYDNSPRYAIETMIKAELAAVQARAERAEGRIASAPIAIMDTRDALGLCAPTEEDFPSLYALQGKTVALVVVDD